MLRGGLQVVTQRNANCKPNSPRGLWSSQLFRAFMRIWDSLSLFYVSLLVLITVKGLRVATVFISINGLFPAPGPIDLHICILSSEMTSRTIGVKTLWVVQMEILNPKWHFLWVLFVKSAFHTTLARITGWTAEQKWDSIIEIKYRPTCVYASVLDLFSSLYYVCLFFFSFWISVLPSGSFVTLCPRPTHLNDSLKLRVCRYMSSPRRAGAHDSSSRLPGELQGQQPPCISTISSSVPLHILPLSGNTGTGERDFFFR